MKRFEITDAFIQQEMTANYGSVQRHLEPGWYVLAVDSIGEPQYANTRETQRVNFIEPTTGLTFPVFLTTGYDNDTDKWRATASANIINRLCQATGTVWDAAARSRACAPSALVGKKIYANVATRESKKVTVDPETLANVERVYINNDFAKGKLNEVILPVKTEAAAATTAQTEQGFSIAAPNW